MRRHQYLGEGGNVRFVEDHRLPPAVPNPTLRKSASAQTMLPPSRRERLLISHIMRTNFHVDSTISPHSQKMLAAQCAE